MSGSLERIYALVMRHIYLWRSSVMRLVDSIYWPAVQMVMWGFMTQYLLPQASFVAQAAGVLLSGLLLWEVVVRGNLSLSIAFLEEMWSRNLGHLFVSPIRSWEMATGIIVVALLRTLLGLIPVSLMAWAFFGFSIYTLGLPLVAFFAILQMFSWSIGLAMSGMIMRVGQSAESFAWAAVFILMPVSGVYYPVSVLPHWLQVIAWGLPPAYVFEGMRAILAEKTVHWDMMGIAFALSAVYLVVGFQIFQWFFRASRRAGTLLGQGESKETQRVKSIRALVAVLLASSIAACTTTGLTTKPQPTPPLWTSSYNVGYTVMANCLAAQPIAGFTGVAQIEADTAVVTLTLNDGTPMNIRFIVQRTGPGTSVVEWRRLLTVGGWEPIDGDARNRADTCGGLS